MRFWARSQRRPIRVVASKETRNGGLLKHLVILFVCFLLGACRSGPTLKTPAVPLTTRPEMDEQLLLSPTNAPEDAGALPNLAGNWISGDPEPAGNGRYITREVQFRYGQGISRTIWGSDKDFRRTLLIYKTEFKYMIEKAPRGKAPANAFFLSLQPTKRSLIIFHRDPDFLNDFDLASCNLVPGREKDISQQGCGDFPSLQICGEEFDIVKLDRKAKELYLGDRPPNNDMCSPDKRPETYTFPLHPK